MLLNPRALSGDFVTAGAPGGPDAGGGAVAALAAQQGVEAEGLAVAHVAGRLHRLGGADAAARHLVAQAAAALAR